jgi:hypothetical protein
MYKIGIAGGTKVIAQEGSRLAPEPRQEFRSTRRKPWQVGYDS